MYMYIYKYVYDHEFPIRHWDEMLMPQCVEHGKAVLDTHSIAASTDKKPSYEAGFISKRTTFRPNICLDSQPMDSRCFPFR